MASLLQKLLTKQSAKYIITTFNEPQAPNLIRPLLTQLPHDTHLAEPKPHHPHYVNLAPLLGPPKTGDSVSPPSPPIFPSFPFGFSLNPNFSTGLVPLDAGDVVCSDTPTIWADSVKKKRKRKMNKHKYKKLRKRLSKHS